MNKIDIFLFPKNTYSPLIRGKKITVYHDSVYFEKLGFREYNFFDNMHYKLMIPFTAKFSIIALAVSEFTASRMIDLLKIDKRKIRIIKEGVEDKFKIIKNKNFLKRIIVKFNLNTLFFFYTGSLSPRKNMLNVLKALNLIKENIKHNIYFTGGYSWKDNEIYSYISENDLSKRIIKLGFLNEEELVAMYNLADCYLYPSKYEEFGLPILEAQAWDCPVITSNVSSSPEVAGDGALFVDPDNIDEIAGTMLKIVEDKPLRNKIVKNGFRNYKKYNWKATAKELNQLFEEVYNQKNN